MNLRTLPVFSTTVFCTAILLTAAITIVAAQTPPQTASPQPAPATTPATKPAAGPERWEARIAKFEADRAKMPSRRRRFPAAPASSRKVRIPSPEATPSTAVRRSLLDARLPSASTPTSQPVVFYPRERHLLRKSPQSVSSSSLRRRSAPSAELPSFISLKPTPRAGTCASSSPPSISSSAITSLRRRHDVLDVAPSCSPPPPPAPGRSADMLQ